ncbi:MULTISPECIES: IclR family transcriptional regulator [unclassified Moraxella]|uniref:IclR family transcriptional regulator n=1 Tax=unclassified Moraxella TaxID=2685852 RepID=UPI003AF60C14
MLVEILQNRYASFFAIVQILTTFSDKTTDKIMARVSSITRVLQIIEAVSSANRPLTPLDLSEMLEIPKPTMHRLIQQLQEEGFVRVDLNGTIVPASRTRHMAIHLWQSEQNAVQRYAILQGLVDKIGETCGVAVPYNLKMVYTDRVPTLNPLQVYMPVDSEAPIWCTATGKLYLSTLPADERRATVNQLSLSKRTANSFDNADKLNRELDKIAESGVGVDNEELIDKMVAIAVPICDKEGRYIASLYAHSPVFRLSLAELLTFTPILQQGANDIRDAFFGV